MVLKMYPNLFNQRLLNGMNREESKYINWLLFNSKAIRVKVKDRSLDFRTLCQEIVKTYQNLLQMNKRSAVI